MKVFAVADVVPEGCDYLTAGKEYEVCGDLSDDLFDISADDEGVAVCAWSGCCHLNGNNWRRVERTK